VNRSGSSRRHRLALVILASASIGLLAAGAAPGEAPAKPNDTITIGMVITVNSKPGWDLLIPNFERAYPDIRVDVTYVPNNAALYQVETTELAAGNAPELLSTNPGCGTPIAICALAKAGQLAPMVNKPWASKKRSLPLVTSYAKFGQTLVAFMPQVAPWGIFTNDTMFKRLGINVPQTYSQLLDVCKKARSAGTAAMILAGGATTTAVFMIEALVVPLLYAKDRKWTAKLKAGKATFGGSGGWRRALQRYSDMNAAGCFQQGAAGVSSGAAAATLFAQGQGLTFAASSSTGGIVAAASPPFRYSFRFFPSGASPTETTTHVSLQQSLSVNAHSTARNQAAAQTFIDFVARPKQNALFARATGGLTEFEFLKGQVPTFMQGFGKILAGKRYVINPQTDWWNPNVNLALQINQTGLLTGQRSVDDILKAMDAAWKEGPS
jgi:raffinose/stachyose/melibiose transport system substrate-binding protein